MQQQALRAELLCRKNIQKRWDPDVINFKWIIRESYPAVLRAGTPATAQSELPNYIVFIDSDLNLVWISRNVQSTESIACISRIAAINSTPCNHLWKSQQLSFRKMIGEAIVAALNGNLEAAAELGQRAEKFLSDRTAECSRKWTLRFSSLSLLGFIIAYYFYIRPNLGDSNGQAFYGYAFFGGICGAYLSIVRKAGKERLDSASGWGIHLLLVLTKMVTGGGFGIISYMFLSCPTICPPLLTELGKSTMGIALLGFISGFCEYFIPNIISKQIPPSKNSEEAGENR